MVLVVGASGMLGAAICRRLVEEGASVRALVRPGTSASRLAAVRATGATVVEGDLRDPESLARACDGVRAVVSTASALHPHRVEDNIDAVDRDGHLALIDAAVARGVAHMVHVSCSGRFEADCALVRAKRAVEARLRECTALTHSILRPTAFMETWLTPRMGLDMVAGTARIVGTGRNRVSWVSVDDVAHFAAVAVTHAFLRNATIELGGPHGLSPLEVVQVCEDLGGEPFTLEFEDEAALERLWHAEGAEPARSVAALGLAIARGDVVPMHRLLSFLPFRLTTVRQYVARTLRPVSAPPAWADLAPYRYVSKKPDPSPLTTLPPIRPDSTAEPFI